jgi:hypothetical protein
MIVRIALEFNYDSVKESQKVLFLKNYSNFKYFFKYIFNEGRLMIHHHRVCINLFFKDNKVFLKDKNIIHNMKLEFI